MKQQGKLRHQRLSLASVQRLILTTLFVILCFTHPATSDVTSIQTVNGMLYAENFTYYKLNGEGWFRLELYSLKGDVDLYVSGLTLHPTYVEHELKSETCGLDTVDIHSSMNRPVGIGIYAHPFYVKSSYKMDILMVKEIEVDEYEQLFKTFHYYEDREQYKSESKTGTERKHGGLHESEEEEESIWWTILITFLKFIFEVIV